MTEKHHKKEIIKEIKTPEKENNSEDIEGLTQKIKDQVEVLNQDIKKISGEMLSSSNLSETEKTRFASEIEELKSNVNASIKNLVQEMVNEDPEALTNARNAISEINELNAKSILDELLDDIQKEIRKSESFDFILNNLPLENIEILRKEYEERKGERFSSITVPDFPMDTAGLHVIQTITKEQPKSLHELDRLIKVSNIAYELTQKKISIETIEKIGYGGDGFELAAILRNSDSIEKLALLDQTELKSSKVNLSYLDLEKLSIEQVKILVKNPDLNFSWTDSDWVDLGKIATSLSSENIAKFKQFDPNSKSIPMSEFAEYFSQIANLPLGVQEICKKEYINGTKIRNLVSYNQELLKNVDEQQANFLNKLIDGGVIKSLNASQLKEYLSLSESIFEKCELVGEDIKKAHVWELAELDKLKNEDCGFLNEVRAVRNYNLKDGIEIVKKIESSIGYENGRLYLEWIQKAGQMQNFDYDVNHSGLASALIPVFEAAKTEKDINLFDLISKAYGGEKLATIPDTYREENKALFAERAFKENPELLIPDILSRIEGVENSFKNFSEVQQLLSRKGLSFSEANMQNIFATLLSSKPGVFLETNSFPLTTEQRKEVLARIIETNPSEILKKYSFFQEEFLSHSENQQPTLDILFAKGLGIDPVALFNMKEFPFSPEQVQYLEIFKKIENSASRELKNLSTEIIPLLVQNKTIEEAAKALEQIEQLFLTNNIPLVGKQYKVFEILYSDERLSESVARGKIDSLKNLHNSGERRLAVFKDLLRAHISSADSNLEQYLLVLKEGREALSTFENGGSLNDADKTKLKLLLKKVNRLSFHSGRDTTSINGDMSDEAMATEIKNLGETFGVRDGESIVGKFERTFLKRVGIDTLDEALEKMEGYRNETTLRNEKGASSGRVEMQPGDFLKGISSDYLDSYLDRGVYAPEFIGAESQSALSTSKSSDSTPLDTDLAIVTEDMKSLSDSISKGYGDIALLLKNKDQFGKDGLEVFKTGVLGEQHYGIRTGFGSTEIDAMFVDPATAKLDQLKFFVAKKGFYIPICDPSGEVLYTKAEYDQYRKIFSGVERFHGQDMEVSEEWKSNKKASEILAVQQTAENMRNVENVRDTVMSKIQAMLGEEGISLHKGKYDDSLKGAVIADTGSTGRGSSLDEKFDFDFAVKLDDPDWSKVSVLLSKLATVFPQADTYENQGMVMFRSGEVEIDGFKMTIDVGFNKKSDAEELDAHDALKEKYDSIKNKSGEQGYLDVLSNIRFAKKKLKEAGCYKKGAGGESQQGGLGGIGVEYWILQNGGDSLVAFKNFKDIAFQDDTLVPFEEFKKSYKIFSAGQNIRGAVKVENFTSNMTEGGYAKMAELAREISQ